MKKQLLIFLIIYCSYCFRQTLAQQKFQITSLTNSSASIKDIRHSLNSGIISLGESKQNTTSHIILEKKSADFSTEWAFSFYSQDSTVLPTSLLECDDRGFLAAARITQAVSGSYPETDILIFKTDELGQLLWSRRLDNLPFDDPRTIIEYPDSSIFIASTSAASSLNPISNISLIRCTANGNVLWSKSFGGNGDDFPSEMILTSDDKLAIAGTSNSFTAGTGFFLSKLDSSGNPLWFNTYFTGFQDSCNGLIQTNDGGFMLIGSGGIDGHDVLMIKTDQNGILQFAHSYNLGFGSNANIDQGLHILSTPDGGYALSGKSRIIGSSSPFLFVIKLSSNLVTEWYRTYGFQLTNDEKAFLQMPDGGFLLGGSRIFPGPVVSRNLLIKTDSTGESGCLQTIIDFTESIETPFSSGNSPAILNTFCTETAFPLSNLTPVFSSDTSCFLITGMDGSTEITSSPDIYPNPFRNEIWIKPETFQNERDAELILLDNSGRLVHRRLLAIQYEGQAQKISLQDLQPGIYLLSIRKDGKILNRKKIICLR